MAPHGRADPSAPEDPPHTSRSGEALEAVRTALDLCPPPDEPPPSNPWHDVLYDRLRDRALPALITDGAITPAASLWTGSRLWIEAFRNTQLRPGDRLLLALPPSAAFVQVLIAALWEGYTIALVPSSDDVEALLDSLDARAAVTRTGGPQAWRADEYAGPTSPPQDLRPAEHPRTPDIRFLLRTSGTTGQARWVALSDRNVLSVLASHLPYLSLQNARALSVLPWTHAFGLVLDLFPALLSGAEIIRDPTGGRSPKQIVDLRSTWGTTHLSAVPLTIQRLIDTSAGRELLHDLKGGIVGGAPVSAPLAKVLSSTRLRAGYGQTEASPGITLGAPGAWSAHYLGQPVGCSVSVASDGELLFQGPNACAGFWRETGLQRVDPARTVHTGDLVRRENDDLYFQGRKDNSFVLSNGRRVSAGALEGALKQTFPELRDALVFSPNGDDVAVALCPDDPNGPLPSNAAVGDVLGSVAQRLVWTTNVPPREWTVSSKGTVDRNSMVETLRATYSSD